MPIKQITDKSEVDERASALISNASAIQAVAAAVEGTLGPKGLDTMLVDRFGEVVVTNAGFTILDHMEVNHPAARMLIHIAKAQHEQIGDGTTTATLMAGTMVKEGLEHILKGVPVTRVVEGIRRGEELALTFLRQRSRQLTGIEDPLIYSVALTAGRGQGDIARHIAVAVGIIGRERLLSPTFRLRDCLLPEKGIQSEILPGVVIGRRRLNKQMPGAQRNALVLGLEDALEPERVEEEALSTEAGFQRSLELRRDFEDVLKKIIGLGVRTIFVERGVSEIAEDLLTGAQVTVIRRISPRELRQAMRHTGGRALKRTALRRSKEEIAPFLGFAQEIWEDEKLGHVRILGGRGEPMATFLLSGATEAVLAERERIAKDAASSVQAALQGGVLPGGGSIELAAARNLLKHRDELNGMASYGLDCVIEALRRPMVQMLTNAGFNPLEKVAQVLSAQSTQESDSLALCCDTGEIADMAERGVWDPALVKVHALQAEVGRQ
ncbi:MAG: TCP-1/cpn60 chaperonin family protein [Armatimonadetes bacterium]|nr:TCP-1/cpn60 chaperonin family protein [Armatimonadota bacterium]